MAIYMFSIALSVSLSYRLFYPNPLTFGYLPTYWVTVRRTTTCVHEYFIGSGCRDPNRSVGSGAAGQSLTVMNLFSPTSFSIITFVATAGAVFFNVMKLCPTHSVRHLLRVSMDRSRC